MVVNAFFFFFHDLIWLYGEIRGGFGNKTVLWKLFVWLRLGDMCGIKKRKEIDILWGKELNSNLFSV